jgi:hypothetical protein
MSETVVMRMILPSTRDSITGKTGSVDSVHTVKSTLRTANHSRPNRSSLRRST